MILHRLARRWLGLPPARFEIATSQDWIALGDGVRLATTRFHPREPRALGSATPEALPTLLLRTASDPALPRRAALAVGPWLAESGYHVVVQEVRGRGESEGRFEPFAREAEDGAEAIDWIERQAWFDGRLGLLGFGYGGHAAWAAAAQRPERVAALVAGSAASDPYAVLYEGGALAAARALRWGLAFEGRSTPGRSEAEFSRAFSFRPFRDADRVALRRSDAFQDWLAHPTRDAYWAERAVSLEKTSFPALLLAHWRDASLAAQLEDFALLARSARERGTPAPRLRVGPARGGRRGMRELRARTGRSLRETIAFLDRHLRGETEAEAQSSAAVRVWLSGAPNTGTWLDLPDWPPSDGGERCLFLHSAGQANSLVGDGRLDGVAPAADEPADRFRFDPEDPTPAGGVLGLELDALAGDQRSVEARADVLCYTSAALEAPLRVAGRPRAGLFFASSAPDTDVVARLVALDESGEAQLLAEGVTRARWRASGAEPRWLEPGRPERIDVVLAPLCAELPAGCRLRLEVSSASLPRWDRSPNTRAMPVLATTEQSEAAEQTLFHDAGRASRLEIPLLG